MHWRVVSLVSFFSALIVLWLFYELGMFSYTKTMAADEKGQLTAESLDSLNKMLQEKSKSLTDKEEQLQRKEQTLAEKEKFLFDQLNRYEKVIQNLKTKLSELETKKDDRMSSFRSIYEKMESKKASKILDQMDTQLAAKILAGMRQEKAADIMGKMSQDKAKVITERYLSSIQNISSLVNETQK
jgi:flagellar motility protein MotE (MotC chaperone)